MLERPLGLNFGPRLLTASELMPDPRDEIEDQRKRDADQDRAREGKIKRCVFATIDNVAGQTADGNVSPASQHQHQTNQHYEQAEPDNHLANFGHQPILKQKRGGCGSRARRLGSIDFVPGL